MDFEREMQEFCDNLKREMEDGNCEFLHLNNVGKIKYFVAFNKQSKAFEEMMNEIQVKHKNNDNAKIYRAEGNKNFALKKNRNLSKAIELYNKSLCFAENKEDIALAYANRSAVYFDWNKYELCLENIKLARINNYPENLKLKLDNREKKCLELICNNPKTNIEKPEDFPKLSYEVNKKIPFIVDCLEIDYNKKYGRLIKTTRDLKPGDFIAIEKPFCSSRTAKYCYLRCSYCLEENFFSLIPCENCTTHMFCNEECYRQAFSNFHKFECNHIDGLKPFLDFEYFCTLRTVFSLFANITKIPALKKIIDEFDEENVNAFTIDHKKTDILDRYKAIHTLNTNETKRLNLIEPAKVSAFIYLLIIRNPIIKEMFENEEYETLFLDLLFRGTQVPRITLGSHATNNFSVYGEGIFGFCGLINHSCAPNVCRLHLGEKIALYVIRTIKKGEQLFDNYGYHHHFHDRKERRERMKSFCFNCNCEACINDYPCVKDLDIPEEINPLLPLKSLENISINDPEFSPKNIQSYIDYITCYNNYYPCVQLFMVYHALHICLENAAREHKEQLANSN